MHVGGSRGHPLWRKRDRVSEKHLAKDGAWKASDRRQAPGLVTQLSKFDFASACPFVARTGYDESAIVKEHFGGDIFFNKFGNARKNQYQPSALAG